MPTPVAHGDSDSCATTSSVVIIGAGVAGITAAQTLHKQGVDDFIIVEYNEEIGGRNTHTTFGSKADGTPYTIELGSNWVQEISNNNPIWLLANKYKIKHHKQAWDSALTYNETGAFDMADVMEQFDLAAYRLSQQSNNVLREGYIDQSERAALTEAGWSPNWNPAAQVAEWFTYDAENAIPPEQTSQVFNAASVPGSEAPGNNFLSADLYVDDQRGFNYFLRREAATFLKPRDRRLLLSTLVTRIAYDANGVTVHTKNGKCIRAAYAVCTVSLGVLQSSLLSDFATPQESRRNDEDDGKIAFDPPLPPWKRHAIASFGIGTYTKIFMQFQPSEIFWPRDKQVFLYADPHVRGNYPLWQSLSLPGFLPGSGIIFATVASPNSAQIEAQSDEETKQQCLAVLRNMFGADKVPEPKAFMYPRWGRMPWARGSYSFWPVGITLEQHENLRGTLKGRLWFAGEHTSAESFGYLHGAWFEGHAVGMRLAACLKGDASNCNPEAHYTGFKDPDGKATGYNRTNGYGVAKLSARLRRELSGDWNGEVED